MLRDQQAKMRAVRCGDARLHQVAQGIEADPVFGILKLPFDQADLGQYSRWLDAEIPQQPRYWLDGADANVAVIGRTVARPRRWSFLPGPTFLHWHAVPLLDGAIPGIRGPALEFVSKRQVGRAKSFYAAAQLKLTLHQR